MISYHKFNEKERSEQIISRICREEIDVALVSDAGTPCVSDPGYALVRQARDAGIEVIGISGPSALITAVSISGFMADSFAFYGFLPRQTAELKRQLERIEKNDTDLFVLYESPKRIVKTMQRLADLWPEAMVCVCCDLSKFHEKSYFGTSKEIASVLAASEVAELGEYTLVVEKTKAGAEKKQQREISPEALLLDCMLHYACTLRQAIAILQQEKPELGRNRIYQASLNLKKFTAEKLT